MKIVRFVDIRNSLVQSMRRNMIVPIIGSGFTAKCESHCGQTPSGRDYRSYMQKQISSAIQLTEEEADSLMRGPFSNVSSIYHQVVPIAEQTSYLRDHFTDVKIEPIKRDFLSLSWMYIYTLNIDDGIENASEYKYIVYSNRPVNKDVFNEHKCLIKLHGHIHDILTYADSKCEVFNQQQYIASLESNRGLLKRLAHDAIYYNLLFIGCSLDDEIDLVACLSNTEGTKTVTERYCCVTTDPTPLEVMKYEKYGITHCIVFESFDHIYKDLYSVGLEAAKIPTDDLDAYRSISLKKLTSDYEQNKPFLLFGKSLRRKDHTIQIPYFFITRKESDNIIAQMDACPVQLLVGSGCSGRTYILTDIACRIRQKDVFLFETKDRLSDSAFDCLFQKKHSVILADSNMFTLDQIEWIFRNIKSLRRDDLNVIIAVDKHDRDIIGLLRRLNLLGVISERDNPKFEVPNKFSEDELQQINPLLTAITAGTFVAEHTIVDNIIQTGESLSEKNKYYAIKPNLNSTKAIAALIALAVERKLYSTRAVALDLYDELGNHVRATRPLIDQEVTWSFERSPADNSPVKYVLNAEYWLCNCLSIFALEHDHQKAIIDAYIYIISKMLQEDGRPDLRFGTKDASYKKYIMFDNINKIFFAGHQKNVNGLGLIRSIYESLNDYLSTDPHYMHQRAKCYIKSSFYEKKQEVKITYLDKAFRDAHVAHRVFMDRFDASGNDKLQISIAHVIYTKALILCHKCYIHNYV